MGHEKDEVRKMSRLAIITARGGSKRIPKKNIRDFCGKPILAYSIEAALSSRLFDHVMVSTDDTEIAEIAKKYGAEVPFFRSEATSGDFATTNDVLAEVLAEYEKRDMHFDVACCIYPTAPFVTEEKLKAAVEQLEASDAAGVVDKLNEVSNNYATSAGDIGAALARSSAALFAGGNSLEESIALITAAQSTIQDAEKVGGHMRPTA